ncbi:MAG: radical SAM protein [Gammaproteobacteria bacterium]|nr:MAG: radical SAM protein [Gammaproteobacteria bacterium]
MEKDKKILFLVPPNISFDDFVTPPSNISTISKNNGTVHFGSVLTDIPLGIISLSAYLKKWTGAETMAVDFNVLLNQEIEWTHTDFYSYFEQVLSSDIYRDFKPDYVGVTALFTPAYESIIDLTEIARKLFPTSLVLVGGNLPTSMYKEILQQSPVIDAVCFGEGEKPFLELLQAEHKHDFLESHSSWVTHKDLAKGNHAFKHDFIDDLDEIPFLDYEILDLDGYKLNPTSARYSVSDKYISSKLSDNEEQLEDAIGKEVAPLNPEKISMPIMTSRGCPFKCTFCASHVTHGRDMRYQSPKRVLHDLKLMMSKFQIDGVVIQDDHFMGGRERPYELVDGIGKLNLEMFFQNALAIYALDLRFLKLLKASGVHELVLPIESGSARVLKELMRKPLRLDLVTEVAKNCREAGIYTDCNIILGMPGETKEDIDDSREFLKTVYADWFRVFVATPIPGSEMYETCEANDYFKITPLKANYKRAVIETGEMTPEYVQHMTYYMNIELNFVYNANLRLKNYDVALENFMRVLSVKSDHGIGLYYVGYCYEMLGEHEKAAEYYLRARIVCEETDFWDVYINDFNIPIFEKAGEFESVILNHQAVN